MVESSGAAHLHAWAPGNQPLRLVEQAVAKTIPIPRPWRVTALLPRAATTLTEAVWLRFVERRPLSAITTQFLDGCCSPLEAQRVRFGS